MPDLRLIILEDFDYDALLIQDTLKRAGLRFNSQVVSERKEFIDALGSISPDAILSDHSLPQFSSRQALQIAREKFPYVPFILVTGTVSDEFAASIIKEGADDYLLKSNLYRLPMAIEQAIEKKQAKRAEVLLASIVTLSDDAIISKNLDGIITSWNKGAEHIFGYSGQEAIGKNISILIPPNRLDEEHRIMEKIKQGELTEHFETQRVNKDGRIIDISLTVSPVKDAQGNTTGASKIARDISGRKKAEAELQKSYVEKQALAERLSAIINTLPANIALLDKNGIIADINDAWRNFADNNGFIGHNYGIGENYLDISRSSSGEDENDGGKVADGITAVLKNETKEFIYEYTCHSPEVKRWFRMVATQLKNKEYAGAVVMHIDISELRRLEQERLESKMEEQKRITRAMLDVQEEERNKLGRELHDNISQLLAAIKMKLKFGLKYSNEGPSSVEQSLEHIEEAITETRNLSHRMVIPRFSESSFVTALQDLSFSFHQKKRSVVLETTELAEKNIPVNVKESLYRIAQEQLNNIEKHAKASKVNIRLDPNADRITMLIEDNGIGFDTKDKKGGIGLTNILNRAESFGGLAKILSEPGKGCKLLVEIPIKQMV